MLVVAPGPRGNLWTYVTAGCRRAGDGVEFVTTSARRDDSIIGRLASAAWRHASSGGAAEQLPPAGFEVPGVRLLRLDDEIHQPGRADDCP